MTPDRRTETPSAPPIVLDARRVGRALAVLVTALVAASLAGQVYVREVADPALDFVARRLDLNAESTVPAYVSALLLLAAGVLLAVTARVTGAGWRSRWGGLAAIFVGLSMDEAIILHESLAAPVRQALGTSGVLYYAWVIPGAAFVLAVGLAYVPFLLRQPPWLARLMVASGALYVGGALGLELVGGALDSAGLGDSWAFALVGSVEEAAEMAGVSLFIYTLLRHLESLRARVPLVFGDTEGASG